MSDLGDRLARLNSDQKARLAALVAQRKGQLPQGYAVVGKACRLPAGISDVDALWALLEHGHCAEAAVPGRSVPSCSPPVHYLSDVDRFDGEFFALSPAEVRAMDATQRVALETAAEAAEQAGLVAAGTTSVGVFVGSRTLAESCPLDSPQRAAPHLYSALGSANNLIAQRLSFHFRWTGPSLLVDTGCTSSLTALHLALKSLDAGECSAAVVVGVNLISRPDLGASMADMEILSPDGSTRCFDAGGSGYGRSEACVALVLQPLQRALGEGKPVWVTLRGTLLGQVGESAGLTAPNGLSQQGLIQRTWKKVGAQPGDFAYLEAQAAASPMVDALEFEALSATYGSASDPTCYVGSIKANLGHAEAASGLVGLLKAALVLRHRTVPPQPLIQVLNPHLPVGGRLHIAQQVQSLPDGPGLAAVHQFGFGGGMAHLVLEGPAERAPDSPTHIRPCLLALTARSEIALQRSVGQLLVSLEGRPDLNVQQICSAVNRVRGGGYEYRLSVLAEDVSQLKALLEGYQRGQVDARLRVDRQPSQACRILVKLSIEAGANGAQLEQALAGFGEAYRSLSEELPPPSEHERIRRALLMWLKSLGVEERAPHDPSPADLHLRVGGAGEGYRLPQELASLLAELHQRGLDLPWHLLSVPAPDWNPPGHPQQKQQLEGHPRPPGPFDLRAEVAAVLGIEPAHLDENRMLLDYGLDSLKRMQLRARLSERQGEQVPIEVVTQSTTLKELVTHWKGPAASLPPAGKKAPSFSLASLSLLIGCLLLWCLALAGMVGGLDPTPKLRGQEPRSTGGGPMSELERHFESSFGFRAGLVRSYGWLSLRLFRSAPDRSFLWTPGDWFLAREELIPQPHHFEATFQQWSQYFESTRAWLSAHGIHYLVVITPMRSDTYPERIPAGFADVSWRRQAIRRRVSSNPANFFNAIDALDPWKGRLSLPLFEPTGGHWNSLGGSLAAMALVDHLRAWFPQLPHWTTRQLQVQQEANFGSDFTWRIGAERFVTQQEVIVWPRVRRAAYRDSGLLIRHPDWLHPYGSEVPSAKQESGQRLPRVVMFHDSTALCLRPLLRESFGRLVSVRNPDPVLVERPIVLRERPDLVLQVINAQNILILPPQQSGSVAFSQPVAGQYRSAVELYPAAEIALPNLCQQPPPKWLRYLPPSRWESGNLRVFTPSGNGGARFSAPDIPAGKVALLNLVIQSSGQTEAVVRWGVGSAGAGVRLDLCEGENEFYLRLDKLRGGDIVTVALAPSLQGETVGHLITRLEMRLAPLALAGYPLTITP